MNERKLSIIAGISYLIIFLTAIYANFFVLDAILTDPVGTITASSIHVRFGAIAFMVAAVFDVVVAWVLYKLYKEHLLSQLSTYFRIMHAAIMGAAVFVFPMMIGLDSADLILQQVDVFNYLWLIGLFFFGIHLVLLGKILYKKIKIIPVFLCLAGILYILDTTAHFLMPHYEMYADIFLVIVAIPSILGEMALALWLLVKGGKKKNTL
jgi:hypothetical protein